jgi:hypothetical protein
VARLSEDMIREMNEMIENQLQCVQGLDRIEKMKLKTKIRQQSVWLGAVLNPSPKVVMEKMQKKMLLIIKSAVDFHSTFFLSAPRLKPAPLFKYNSVMPQFHS